MLGLPPGDLLPGRKYFVCSMRCLMPWLLRGCHYVLKLRNKLRALRVRIDMFIMYGRHVLTPGKYLLHRLRCLLLNLLLGLDHMRDLQHKL